MRFLVDECLHTSLVTLAHEAGYICEHVNFLGLGGQKDWQLMTKIRAEEYTFVTNNRTDFAALYAKEDCMPDWLSSCRTSLLRASGSSSEPRYCTSAGGI
jgi:predicted nuclease of predicted toxin-antitoxin system